VKAHLVEGSTLTTGKDFPSVLSSFAPTSASNYSIAMGLAQTAMELFTLFESTDNVFANSAFTRACSPHRIKA
jgi:hypothetical protein